MSMTGRDTYLRFSASAVAMAMAIALPAHATTADEADAMERSASRGSVLSGHVYDESGSALPGARVFVPELNSSATTDLQGEFVMPAPAQGDVTVKVEYLGRPTTSSVVTLSDRQTVMNIVVPRGGAGDIVVLASLVDNTARALNQQRQADNTISVISADAIGRFPDPNVAEALQRIAGIGIERDQGEGRYINIRGAPADFSTVTVDGAPVAAQSPSTRAIDLDTIPSDIVANLEVTKSLLPNQDADAISGSVNIATRSAFDSKGFRLSAAAGASYNDYGGTSDKRASLSVSDRFGPDKQFGIVLAGSYSKTDRQLDNVENGWVILNGSPRVSETVFKDYDTKRERISANGALEWRPSPGNRLYVRGSYSRFKDDEIRNRLSILWTEGAVQPGATDSAATFANTRIEKQIRHRIQINEIYTATAGGEHLLGEGKVDYSASYSKSTQTYPRRDELLFRSSLRPTLRYDFATPDNPSYSLFNSNEHLQAGSFAFRENAYRSNDTENEEWGFATKAEVPIYLGSLPVTISAGGRYRDRSVVANEERFRDRRATASPSGLSAAGSMTPFLTDEASENFNYNLGYKLDPSKADAYFDATRGTSERRMPQSITADYRAGEKILGIFGMAKFDLGDTIVIAGVRYETTDFRGSAPTSLTATANVSKSYANWFPNLTVRHAFSPDLIARFALSRGINRPNFVDIVPRSLDESDSNTTRITDGNPDLRPTLSNNVDAGLEYYLRPVGLISINAFYKDLEDYRYTLTRTNTGGGVTTVYTRPENAPKGHLYGAEISWQQQFTFLPGLLSGFGLFANFTWTDAEIKLAQAFAGRQIMPLPGQSKTSWNASLFYEKGPFNARVSYTKRSDYLNTVDATNPLLDLYWEGRGQLDATGSYQIMKAVNLFVEAKNLTNSAGVRYYGSRERVYEYEKFGYSLFGGVRIKL